jgi:L-asparaginase/Glu-tRNA(Gln) amidotransferase subunit D
LVTLPDQQIVFTGANYPHGSPHYDGWKNIIDSLQVLQSEWPDDIRTACVLNGKILAPHGSYKVQTNQNGLLTIKSHPQGEFGTVNNQLAQWNSTFSFPNYFQYRDVFSKLTQLPWVPIYYDHPEGEKTLDLLLKEKPAAMIVVGVAEGFINENLLAKITAINIPVMRTSNIPEVEVKWRERYDDRHHTIPAGTLSPAQAQILMSFAVGAGINLREIFS